VTESKTRTRMKVLAGLVVFMFAALTTRLWFLQVLATGEFAKLAEENQVRLVPLQPLRGVILDRDGNILVGNRPSTIVTVDRMAMRGQEEQILYRLSTLLNVPVTDLLDRLNSVKYLPYQPVPVAEDVPKETVFYIEEHRKEFKGVSYQVGAVRNYRYGSLASHVLGWTGEISDKQLSQPEFKLKDYRPGAIVGKSGVEAAYEQYLHGSTDGKREIQVNAQGVVLNENFNVYPPKPGDNVVLSIDGKVQQLAEQSLELGIELARRTADRSSGQYLRATGGAVIVMDPRNGKVLALATDPTFDPSIFLGGLNRREALSLDLCFGKRPCPKPSHNNPLLNRATQGLYPAGSTFKPFVAVGALKEKFARTSGRYPCPSIYYAPVDPTRHPFHNWSSLNYGNLSLSDALAYSCDTVFYKFGYDFWLRYHRSGEKKEPFQRDLMSMGFARKTGIDLPGEQRGRIPDHAYVKRLYDSNPCFYGSLFRSASGKPRCSFLGWLPGDAINLSIGQGFMTVTPMQLAVGYSAIANGGTLYAPQVVDRIESPDGDLIRKFSPQFTGTLPIPRRQVLFLRNALKGVTRFGTARSTFEGFPLGRIPVAGKTGTADILPLQPTSWFAAIAPADHPKYVVVAMVEQGGHGSTTAAPLVRRVLEGLFGLNPPPRLQAGSAVD
jgi:penicillin-binding protein 2